VQLVLLTVFTLLAVASFPHASADFAPCARSDPVCSSAMTRWSGDFCCAGSVCSMSLIGEATSPDYNIIGGVSNNWGDVVDRPFVNRFSAPSSQCYGPANAASSINPNGRFWQMGVVGQDMCVRIKCDGSGGFWGIGAQNCNVHLNLFFTCYNPCNNCPADTTATCAVVPPAGGSVLLPTAQCTCKAGWSGDRCTEPSTPTAPPVDSGWSD